MRLIIAVLAALGGVAEALSIDIAVHALGKTAVMPFIAWAVSHNAVWLVIALRLLIVFLAHRWGMHEANAALATWWWAWVPVNLS